MKQKYLISAAAVIIVMQGCSAFSEVEVKRYEDYFPSAATSSYKPAEKTEEYETYSADEYAQEPVSYANNNVSESL